jgi:hypothetical protein
LGWIGEWEFRIEPEHYPGPTTTKHIPQVVGHKQSKPKGGDNENLLNSCPSRIVDQLRPASLCPRERSRSTGSRAVARGGKKFEEAYNKNDASAVGALFTDDAVLVTPHGTFTGRKAIEEKVRGRGFSGIPW